ncbi:type II toxin-antitoxin system RelE/ParE family toxin [Rhizobium esperanzae]
MRSRRLTLSRKAIDDLTSMFRYIARDDPVAAKRLIDQIGQKIEQIARSGFTGVNRNWLSPGLRAIIHKNRCIYFVVRDDELHVLRVLHGREDASPEDFIESSH